MAVAFLLFPAAATLSSLRASYTTTINEHVSELMPLYLNPRLNGEWNQRMSTQNFLVTPEHGEVVHQTYKLPWPLKTRELVMHCVHNIARGSHTVTATCHSARSAVVPESSDNVRMEIEQSKWIFTALANGKTHITTEILISDKFSVGVPSVVTKFVQDNALKESVHQFIKASRRLKLPPHPQFVSWRRSREQTRRATHGAEPSAQPSVDDDAATWWQLAASALALLVAAHGGQLVTPRVQLWWRTRHAPRAVRKVGRAVSRAALELPPRVPRDASAMPRSVSLTQMSAYAGAACPTDVVRSTEALLHAESHSKMARQRRSLSASNLATVWKLS